MDMNQAAVFLAGSILTGLGFVVVFITVLVINNLLSKYWKPVQWMRMQEHPMYQTTQVEPTVTEPVVSQNTAPTNVNIPAVTIVPPAAK